MRARLEQLGLYSGEDAVREVQRAFVEAGERLWDSEVPEDEGGITPPLAEAASEDELSTQTEPPNAARAIASSTRHPDEVTTVPGGGPHRLSQQTPRKDVAQLRGREGAEGPRRTADGAARAMLPSGGQAAGAPLGHTPA